MMHRKKTVLIFNELARLDKNFYIELFSIPELSKTLYKYKKVLERNHISIPLWLYSFTHGFRSFAEDIPHTTLSFLVSYGLFKRWIKKTKSWPSFLLVSEPMLSLIKGKVSFEEQSLLLNSGYCKDERKYQLYQASSYLDEKSEGYKLLSLKKVKAGSTNLTQLVRFLTKKEKDLDLYQFVSPQEEEDLEANVSDLYLEDFLTRDSELSWLWPKWKRAKLEALRQEMSFVEGEN